MANEQQHYAGKRVALGVSGGIAAYKAVEVLRGLQKAGCVVRVAMTLRACEFIRPLTFRALTGEHVIVDDYAPDNPDPIAHITFSQTVDLFLVAPASESRTNRPIRKTFTLFMTLCDPKPTRLIDRRG